MKTIRKPLRQKILIAIGLLLSPLLSPLSWADDWSEPSKVADISAGYITGVVLFATEKPPHNPNNCDANFYAVQESTAQVDQILSVLLAAQKSGGLIQVGVNSKACDHVGRISVTRIRSLP